MNNAMSKAIAQRVNNAALYEAMCKGKVPQRGIHRFRNGKRCAPILGNSQPYHGHITFK